MLRLTELIGMAPQLRRISAALAAITLVLSAEHGQCQTATSSQAMPAAEQSSPDAAACLARAHAAAGTPEGAAALADFLVSLQRQAATAQWRQPMALGQYRVTFASPKRNAEAWDPATFDSYVPASSIPVAHLRSRVATGGAGAAMVGIRSPSQCRADANPYFSPEVGMASAVTAVADFRKQDASGLIDTHIALLNPKNSSRQLAADYSAPLEILLAQAPPEKSARQGLFRPLDSGIVPGLFMPEPYQRGKIPVVMVHGLDSAPRTWVDVYNELQADPVVRSRYQFWFYRYPTGNPVLLSAAGLRRSMQGVKAMYVPKSGDAAFNQTVLIGHSMGGLLSRLMVTESGNAFWPPEAGLPETQANLSENERRLLQESMFFSHQPYVKRVVFIATPHRGSDIASGLVGRMGSRLINMPGELTGMTDRISTNPNGVAGRLDNLQVPTSIDNLSPDNRFVQILQVQPIYARYHSIVGSKGVSWRGVPVSDGIVPYDSSYLPGAESEFVVPAGHSAHHDPIAVCELDRILREHIAARPRQVQ